MRPRSLYYMYCILVLQACLAKWCKIKKQKNCKTTNRLKQQVKNIKTVEPHVVESWNAESAFEISFKFNVGSNLNASKEGWLSALWRWISPPSKCYWVWIVVLGLLNRLSNSNIAWLKLKTCQNKGIFLEIDSHICGNVLIVKFLHLKTLHHWKQSQPLDHFVSFV